ncbi:MAG: hypothetical protein COX77_02070 [Candidatus Komeilibacteria bacterium CG_4_10_14_0_2_um_filter_37_10]|uniref:Uncharacterized protein n=1 Tax=Candidatus Komeilibacteria bacterium CG_4_10_14_0_2_um_filter_37_10 TaxID=1974470 RepID=A0A2M7VFG0_9BACT|nr:MAG: hypothetical protein COX77_02070 [Candidatus Komeilibacteria bacterium CG_4_10_14_0_2_um_filter_37_10]
MKYAIVFDWHNRVLHSSEYPHSKCFSFDADSDDEAMLIAKDYESYCRAKYPNESYNLLSIFSIIIGIKSRLVDWQGKIAKVRRLPIEKWHGPPIQQVIPDESILKILAYQEPSLFAN